MKDLYAKFTRPESGYPSDIQDCKDANLELGKAYHVTTVDMNSSMTRIMLSGIKGLFNSVHFDFYEVEKVDITMLPRYNRFLPQDNVPELGNWNTL